MECKLHPGVEADLTCLKCGQQFCRECVKETRESHYCPECHRAEVERLASQMGGRKEPKEKVKKEKAAKEARLPAEKRARPTREARKPLRRPSDKPGAPPAPVMKEETPPPPPSVSPEEKAEFWGDDERRPPVIPPIKKRPIQSETEREKAVLVSEGFPSAESAEKAEKAEALGLPARRVRRKKKGDGLVEIQLPEDYDGEVTNDPSYFKAVVWGILIGLVSTGVFTLVSWLRPQSVSGIFGWLIGLSVGVAVAVGSGRHFNWKLGLIACGLSLFLMAAGMILSNVLTYYFPTGAKAALYKLLRGDVTNTVTQFPKQFIDRYWWLFFTICGATAFLVSFRPWPFKFNIGRDQAPARTPARRRA